MLLQTSACCRKLAPSACLAGADPDRPKRPLPARLAAEAALEAAMVDLAGAARKGAAGVRRELQRAGFHVSEVGGGDVPGCWRRTNHLPVPLVDTTMSGTDQCIGAGTAHPLTMQHPSQRRCA